jgi:hypothetical protein
MPEFTGIYNENEFYFAHYLTSLMDDDLREFCASDTGQTVQRRLRSLAEPWRKGRSLREQVEKRGATREMREAYEAARRQLVEALAGALGYADHLTCDGVFHGATPGLQIPVRAAVRRTDGTLQTCLIEVYRTGEQFHREIDLLDLHPTDAQCAHLDNDSRSKLTSLTGHRATDTLSWSNLIIREIFGSVHAPRFVIVFGEDRLLLLERSKWAERRHLAFNLDEIFERCENATLRAMTGLLACPSLCPEAGTCLPDRLEENSHKNAFGVSKDLRISMRDSIERLGNAILDSSKKARKATQSEAAEGTFSAAALSAECVQVMYRFLFVLFLESRRDIPYFDPPGKVLEKDIFWSAYGLDQLRDLELTPLLTPEARRGLYFDKTVKQLFDKIYSGFARAPDPNTPLALETLVPGFRLPPLASHLFDPDKTPLFNASDIPNEAWQQIVRNLSIGTSGTGRKRRKGRISYAQLGIQQLGAVYEALLSYTGFYATADLYEVCRSAKKSVAEPAAATETDETEETDDAADPDADSDGAAASGKESDLFETGYFVTADELPDYKEAEIIAKDGRRVCHRKGTFIYRMAGRDREKSASYYTPAELTRALVRHALAERIPADMPADEIMRLKVCEPAMGSAAFLNEAVDQIADLYLARKQQELKKTIPLDNYAKEKARVKMVFADRNVYGVDLNPVATHLAEVSLWLGTIGGEGLPTGQADRAEPYIPWFGTQLRCGNSIVGARREIVRPDGTRRALAFGNPLPEGAVWHFLLPEAGMGDYTDKTVKTLVPEAIAAFKAWRAKFELPKGRKGSAASRDAKWEELEDLSRAIETLWQEHVADLRQIDEATADDIAYFGYTPHKAMYTDTATKDRILARKLGEQNLRESSAYCKLKLVMDLWCALWFWPLDAADALPSYDAFLEVVRLVVEKEWQPVLKQGTFADAPNDPAVKETAVAYLQQKMDVDTLGRVYPFVPVVARVAAAQHFMHWEVEFAQVFADRGGFDLILGNPPWVQVEFDEAGILSEYDPHIAIRKMASDQTSNFRDSVFDRKPAARGAYLGEYAGMTGLQNFLGASCNYPLHSGKANLFKFFLPLAFRLASPQGVSAYLHPEGVYDDPQGGALRRAMYPRLRLHAQFINELCLFADVDHHTAFSLNVYGPACKKAQFITVAGLYHPSTLRESLERTDETHPLPLVREDGTWNLRGHPHRVVTVDDDLLALFARTYDATGTPAREARLPALYTRTFADILPRFADFQTKMASQEYGVSDGWNETTSRKDGTIRRDTARVAKADEVIYSGPIFFVGNPLAKCPRNPCRLNSDYDILDLTVLPQDYRVRTNYSNALPTFAEYRERMATYQDEPVADFWRVCCRRRCNAASERTLIPCCVPQGYSHVHTVITYAFASAAEAGAITGSWASIPFDWFFRTMNKPDFFNDSAKLLPYLPQDPRVIRRVLMLNCLTTDWAELWAAAWAETDLSEPDGWLGDCPVLPQDAFSKLGPAWTPAMPLRSALARRQALVELDVLAAQALGLSLEELQTMFRISFTTLRKYDGGTWYDQNGRVVFTCQNKAGGVPRKVWEKELLPRKDDAGFTYSHTESDQAFTDAKTARTTVYVPPFFTMDRERDYQIAWDRAAAPAKG